MRISSRFYLIISLLITIVVVAACGGDPAPTPTPTEAPTQPFLATDVPTVVPTATSPPALPPPTDVPLDVQLSDLSAGGYALTLVGAINSDLGYTPFTQGDVGYEYEVARGGSNDAGPYSVSLWTDILTDGTTDDTTARITFTIPATIEAGTYDVVAIDAQQDPDDIGIEVSTGFGSQRFATNATGTISIIANSGVGGVFTGEFEVSVGDDDGNTVLATGRASAIPFDPLEYAELNVTGALTANPPLEELIYSLGVDRSTAANNDWRLELAAQPNETNPYIIQHRFNVVPNISAGTYEIQPRLSAMDARTEDIDVVAFVQLFNPTDGTIIEPTEITGTFEVLPLRDRFTATFTMTYTLESGDQVTAEGGAYYMLRPAG